MNGREALALYLHPPAQISFTLPFGHGGTFRSAVAIQPEAWDKPKAGGCRFSLFVNGCQAYQITIDPTKNPADRCWHEFAFQVTESAHHEIVMMTEAIGEPADFRWALWRNPLFEYVA